MVGLISLADAKRQVKVEDDGEDTLLESIILAAGRHIERETGYVCPPREAERVAVLDAFPCSRRSAIVLPLRPVDADSVAVSYFDTDGETQAFTDVRVFEMHGLVRIVPAFGFSWPTAACEAGAVTVTADLGFAAATDDVDSDVDDDLKHAARLLVGHWYRNREAVVTGTISSEIQRTVDSLLEPHRIVRV